MPNSARRQGFESMKLPIQREETDTRRWAEVIRANRIQLD